MTLNEYQEKAMSTCMPSCMNFTYMFCNLVGEIGEFASKVAKLRRKGLVSVREDKLMPIWRNPFDETLPPMSGEDYDNHGKELRKEVGDLAWQLAGLCSSMGWTLEEVCAENLEKLAARKVAGTIDGNGDGISGRDRR